MQGKKDALYRCYCANNCCHAELVVVLPVTSKSRNIPLRIQLNPPEGGLRMISYVMPEMIRSMSLRRLTQRLGAVPPEKMATVEAHVQNLLGFT
jgi:mRNA interferase MazF